MIGKLVLTHGGLARELLAAAQVIAGSTEGFEALSLDWNDPFESARAKVAAAVARLDQGEGVLILTDMFGGTPCNVALTFQRPGTVEILTGVNLPMVLRLACQGSAVVVRAEGPDEQAAMDAVLALIANRFDEES